MLTYLTPTLTTNSDAKWKVIFKKKKCCHEQYRSPSSPLLGTTLKGHPSFRAPLGVNRALSLILYFSPTLFLPKITSFPTLVINDKDHSLINFRHIISLFVRFPGNSTWDSALRMDKE